MKSKFISGTFAAVYLITAYVMGGGELALRLFIFLLLPLACIWFGEAMGGYIGFIGFSKPQITQKTPGCIVEIGGWFLLSVPIIAWLIRYFPKE
jgi:hypothetical protein